MFRTMLRLATTGVLLNGGGPPWPTLVGEFVYDSLIDSIVDVTPNGRKPVIVVRTDEDQVGYRNAQENNRQCRLLIEISMVTAATVNGVARLDWPRTDSSMEGTLDLLEWQVRNALFGHTSMAHWWQSRVAIVGYSSSPRFSPPERGSIRLAVRNLELLTLIPLDCTLPLVAEWSAEPIQPRLPPRWEDFVEQLLLCSTGGFRASVEELARTVARYGALPVPTAPPFQRVWATLPDGDGVEAEWKLEQEAPLAAIPLVTEPPQLGAPTLEGESNAQA